MARFFVEDKEILNDRIILRDENYIHLSRSLRARLGDKIEVCDGKGNDYYCEIVGFSETDVELKILKNEKTRGEPKQSIILFQALPKSDKLDFIVQKATELGITEIVPVNTKFCVAKADKISFDKKRVRLNKIALEAGKQSGRGVIPTVRNIMDFNDAAKELTKYDNALVCYEHGGVKVKDIIKASDKSIAVFIGSEGGFSEDEIATLKDNGVVSVSLGELILRCETASITAITLIRSALGDM